MTPTNNLTDPFMTDPIQTSWTSRTSVPSDKVAPTLWDDWDSIDRSHLELGCPKA